jgi:1,4-alpha-glucan branching enzyme
MAAAFLMSVPGPKMLWQFGELGYDKTIDLNGRTGNKPILWNYYTDPDRKHLFSVYSQMIKMREKKQRFCQYRLHLRFIRLC